MNTFIFSLHFDLEDMVNFTVLSENLQLKFSAVPQADGTFRYPWTEATGPQPGDQEALLGFQKSIFIVDVSSIIIKYSFQKHDISDARSRKRWIKLYTV